MNHLPDPRHAAIGLAGMVSWWGHHETSSTLVAVAAGLVYLLIASVVLAYGPGVLARIGGR